MAKPGFFTRMRRAIAYAWNEKASQVGPMISRLLLGRPVWPGRDFEQLAREGYKQNPVVYACIKLIAKSVADVPWVAYKGKGAKQTEVEEHEFLDLMDHPNIMQDRTAFLESVVSDYLITGNSYIERTSEDGNFKRMELYSHRPYRMKVIPGATGVPQGYEYAVGGDKRVFEVDPDTGALPILHLKTFNPAGTEADWYGQSPLDPAAWAIDIHNGESQQTRALQENAGSPSGALVFEGTTEGGNTLSAEDRDTIQARLRGEEHGYDRKGSRMFVDGGKYSWLQFGLDPDKLKSLDSKNQAAREIAFTLGVPPMLLGIPGDNTYSNYQEARQAFYQETVIPLARLIVQAFNHWFRDQLGKGVYLEANIDELDALQPSRTEQWNRLDKTQMLTLNEKRSAIGYEDVDGGDEMYGDMGKIPLSMSGKEFMGGSGDPLAGLVEDDPEAKKPKGGGAKHMPSGAVHRHQD